MMKKLVVATKNKDKLKEIQDILRLLKVENVDIIPLFYFSDVPDVVEDGKTLKENAIKKAKTVGNFTGLPSLAEDSGLFVDYLNGEPGVYSARYADNDKNKHSATYKDNYMKLLNKMVKVNWEKRSAKFVCVAALYDPKKNKCWTRKGEVKGFITWKPVGDKGFGYDPVFYYPPIEKTFAEIDVAQKNKISHRFIAIKQIKSLINKIN